MKKTMIKTVKSLVFIALVFLSSSCTKLDPLKMEESPIVFTSEAQIKVTHIKNLMGISSNDPNDENKSGNGWSTVKNGWIYCYFNRCKNVTQDLKIEVKENTSIENRTLKLVIGSKIYGDTLIITQLGKTE
ncbi:MAG: hypothetical protein IMY73_05190 [Bacteroidetes bacterium]|nr:hypothetical protein [Bacteroidota bacterium]